MAAEHPSSVEQEPACPAEKDRKRSQQEQEIAHLQQELSIARKIHGNTVRSYRLLVGIIRHDIPLQLTVLAGYHELVKTFSTDPGIVEITKKEQKIAATIQRLIEATRPYQDLGVRSPAWLNLRETVTSTLSSAGKTIILTCQPDLEILADPVLANAFPILLESPHTPERVITEIRISTCRKDDALVVVWEDDGPGIPDDQKDTLFRARLSRAGPDLFLVQEIAGITGISIRETGTYGKGARFEMTVPAWAFRFTAGKNAPPGISGEIGQESCLRSADHTGSNEQEPADLAQENRELKEEIELRDRELQELRSRLEMVQMAYADANRQRSILTQETENRTGQTEELRKDLALALQRSPLPVGGNLNGEDIEILRLRNEVTILIQINDDLRRRIETDTLEHPQGIEFQRKLTQLRKELSSTREEFRKDREKRIQIIDVIRRDILNNITVLKGYLDLSKYSVREPDTVAEFINRMMKSADMIEKQINFLKFYRNTSMNLPIWQNINDIIGRMIDSKPPGGVQVVVTCPPDLEILADPLLGKVFATLLDNSLRHGERVTEIRVSLWRSGSGLVVAWEDNGVGIPPDQKEKIFEAPLKRAGFALFLNRQILSSTGITIHETGIFREGARFEMAVPEGAYRFSARKDADSR